MQSQTELMSVGVTGASPPPIPTRPRVSLVTLAPQTTSDPAPINTAPTAPSVPSAPPSVVVTHTCRYTEGNRIRVLYTTRLSGLSHLLPLSPLNVFSKPVDVLLCKAKHTLRKFDDIKDRGYIRVMENRIESNYPAIGTCGCGSSDEFQVIYFDRLWHHAKKETCSPYQWPLFGCYASGEVVALGPSETFNSAFCPVPRQYYPGVDNATELADALNQAFAGFLEKKRLEAGALQPPSRPIMV